ncbi:hypothetical protein [Niabella drilacis]|uniref:Uncharacterized protein n=1 Tax=Niabella drilacis (strain DSM 25811 / CCM 8410 / CCUG 62505 / LMG 26954 / E90) TaxID=1285928 RepID=A0A1G6URT6_NIADE|nr:hypothetical protein [Niabella drilacis]SDD43426.1 hypothetical protein SAMN04487894_10954 [Niabella drilacis]
MLNLKYIVENSGDSILENYNYSGGVLMINLYLSDLEKKVLIEIRTDEMSFKNYYLDQAEELYKTCRIEVQALSDILSVENGIYVPSGNFGKFMNEKKTNRHLAYGEKITAKKYIFSLVGYDRLISCLVFDLDCITLYEVASTNG